MKDDARGAADRSLREHRSFGSAHATVHADPPGGRSLSIRMTFSSVHDCIQLVVRISARRVIDPRRAEPHIGRVSGRQTGTTRGER